MHKTQEHLLSPCFIYCLDFCVWFFVFFRPSSVEFNAHENCQIDIPERLNLYSQSNSFLGKGYLNISTSMLSTISRFVDHNFLLIQKEIHCRLFVEAVIKILLMKTISK